MPTSRFDININQPYQSVRIPLPLDYLAGIAKNLQGEHDQGVKVAEDFSKLGQAIKASPVGEGIKQQLIGEMKADMENTYNSTKSYSSPDFQRKVQDLSNKWANDPRITYLKAEKDLFEQNQKDLADKNNSRDLNYTYSKFYDPTTGTYSQAKSINELPLSSRITKYADAYKTQADMMNNIAASAFDSSKGYDFSHPQSGVGPGGEYYAFNKVTNQVEKIDKNDIDRIATASLPLYAKTDAGTFELQKEAQKYIGDKAYGLDYDKLSQLAQQDDGYAALKETIDQKFKQDLTGVGEKQIFTKSKYDVDNMTLADRQAKDANDDKKFIESLTSSTVEGRTFDAIQGDSTMKGLLNTGVFKNTNGVITFDQNALLKPSSTFDVKMSDGSVKNVNSYQEALDIYHNTKGVSITPNDKVRTVKINQTEFNNQLIKMSNAVGIDPKSLSKDGKIDSTAISKLASSYNQLTKSRSLDLNLSPAVQNSESRNANINWYNVKQVDPNDPTTPIANTPLIADEKVVVVNRRTDKNGKVYNEGYIENTKTKEVKPIAFRSQSTEKNLVFDALGKIQKVSIDNLSKSPNENPVMTKPIHTQYGTTSMEIIGKENIGQGYYIQALTDPHNKYNTLYTIRNSKHEIIDMKQNLGDLKKSVETFYFTRIPEGRIELENLKTNTKQAEDQQAQ